MLKKKITFRFIVAAILICLVFSLPVATKAAVTSSQIDAAISWASSQIGSKDYKNNCLFFVSTAYKKAGFDNPNKTGSATEAAKFVISTDYTSMPKGCLVFYNWKTLGHVGLYIGEGKIISANGNNGGAVTINDYDDIKGLGVESLIGWGWLGGIEPVQSGNSTISTNNIRPRLVSGTVGNFEIPEIFGLSDQEKIQSLNQEIEKRLNVYGTQVDSIWKTDDVIEYIQGYSVTDLGDYIEIMNHTNYFFGNSSSPITTVFYIDKSNATIVDFASVFMDEWIAYEIIYSAIDARIWNDNNAGSSFDVSKDNIYDIPFQTVITNKNGVIFWFEAYKVRDMNGIDNQVSFIVPWSDMDGIANQENPLYKALRGKEIDRNNPIEHDRSYYVDEMIDGARISRLDWTYEEYEEYLFYD